MTPEEVRAARHQLGLTQSQLATRLRLNSPYGKDVVRSWESGKRPISGPASLAIELLIEGNGITGDGLAGAILDVWNDDLSKAYVDVDDPRHAVLDGGFDLERIAKRLNERVSGNG